MPRSMLLVDQYIDYIFSVKRYSPKTAQSYLRDLEEFFLFAFGGDKDAMEQASQQETLSCLSANMIRSWEVHLLDALSQSSRTVWQKLSALSGFCRYLIGRDMLESNPVASIKKPKQSKRLPEFYRQDAMSEYFAQSERYTDGTMLELYADAGTTDRKESISELWKKINGRMIISILYHTGIRRSELISLRINSVDLSRQKMRVIGKGDKAREIPLVDRLCKEISVYLRQVELMVSSERRPDSPLLVTFSGKELYPVYVDRAVKQEIGDSAQFPGRHSPHVLRHTLATALLENGTDLYSIKELLGHSSLAATQVYTHSSIAQLKQVYQSAHPRAKNGGKNGD